MEGQSDTISGLPSTSHEKTCSSSSSQMGSQMSEGPFSTVLVQVGEQGYNETLPQPSLGSTTKKSQRGRNFSIEEDIILVMAWLNSDIDLIQGNNKKPKTFWERISENYHEHNKETMIERSMHSLSNRWSTIQLSTNKFCEYLAQVESRNPSGVSDQDKIDEAKAMYRKFEKITFQFDHCWNMLRKVPKWNSRMVQMKSRRKSIGTISPSTPEAIHLWEDNDVENVFVDFGKPLGKKTSEERERKRKSKDSPTLNTMDALSKLKEGKMISYEERNEQIYTAKEEVILVEKQKLEIEQRKEEREQRKEEWEIMMMDTSNLSPMQQEYIHLRRVEILEKRRSK